MSDFWIYLQLGFRHVLDLRTYDHYLFLIALMLPYTFKEWKQLLLLVGLFTIGHTASSLLAAFGFMQVRGSLIGFLIPVIVLITATYSLITAGKTAKGNGVSAMGFVTIFFGIIHGLGFLPYVKSIHNLSATNKVTPLLEIGLGIGLGHIAIACGVLVAGYAVQNFTRFSRRDWGLTMSAFVIGMVLPMIFENKFWN